MKLIIYIKMDLALDNPEKLIYHETQQTKSNQTIGMIHFVYVIYVTWKNSNAFSYLHNIIELMLYWCFMYIDNPCKFLVRYF